MSQGRGRQGGKVSKLTDWLSRTRFFKFQPFCLCPHKCWPIHVRWKPPSFNNILIKWKWPWPGMKMQTHTTVLWWNTVRHFCWFARMMRTLGLFCAHNNKISSLYTTQALLPTENDVMARDTGQQVENSCSRINVFSETPACSIVRLVYLLIWRMRRANTTAGSC